MNVYWSHIEKFMVDKLKNHAKYLKKKWLMEHKMQNKMISNSIWNDIEACIAAFDAKNHWR
jgi:hypothetical protein